MLSGLVRSRGRMSIFFILDKFFLATSILRAGIIIFAPARESCLVISKPIPEYPPVMMIVFPERLIFFITLFAVVL